MKRNNLMKRMAVVALAATMSVGMAVPAMAAQGQLTDATTRAKTHYVTPYDEAQPLDHFNSAEDADWFEFKSWEDTGKIELNSAAGDTSADFYINNGVLGHYVNVTTVEYVYTYNFPTYTKAQYDSWQSATKAQDYIELDNGNYVSKATVSQAAQRDNLSEGTNGILTSNEYATVNDNWKDRFSTVTTTTAVWEKLDDYHTTYDFVGKPGSAEHLSTFNGTGWNVRWELTAVNDNYFKASVKDNTLSLTPDKFGTTIYHYVGKLYHGNDYEGTTKGDVEGYVAITMPLNDATVEELVNEGAKNVVSTNGVNTAAKDGATAIQNLINSKAPKVWEYSTNKNNTHDIAVSVDLAQDFHAATGYKAHVVVTDKTTNHSKDYGYKNFTFAKAPVSFTDVADTTAYYYAPVYWGVQNGLVKGKSDTTFAPYDNLTREQLIVMLYRHAGSPAVEINNKFDDLAGLSDESKKAISWGVQNGIVNGTTEVKFSPKDNVSRAQVVTMLYRLAGSPSDYNETNFTDVAHGSYYEDAVDWAVNQKIVNGTSLTTFSPKADTTRAQGITLLYRYFNR